ncbi:MAG: alanine racemase, partial [Candidatus Gracilibacteria bacterium]
LFTHFTSAKNPAFPKDTKEQIAEFQKWIKAFQNAGLKPIVHAAATAGSMVYPESHFDMVRIGIGLYGLWPAKEIEAFLKDKIALKPVLTWKTIVSELKKIPAGGRVGYDLTETVGKNSTIAVCPIGYWHGYPRNLSSIGRVVVCGRKAKVLGRISMDMIVIDVSGIPKIKAGSEVVLLSGNYPETSAEQISHLSDTSYYEIITRLNPLIKRIYIGIEFLQRVRRIIQKLAIFLVCCIIKEVMENFSRVHSRKAVELHTSLYLCDLCCKRGRTCRFGGQPTLKQTPSKIHKILRVSVSLGVLPRVDVKKPKIGHSSRNGL